MQCPSTVHVSSSSFVAACCGNTTKNENALDEDAQDATPPQNHPESNLALARVHAILDHMSSSEC
eukprot:696784-Karenia_brevis.AAC.1